MARGKFIVIEGGEGSGKSEMTERLKGIMPRQTMFIRDPGGTTIGEEIRSIVLSHESRGIDAATELLLFSAARTQLIAECISPALIEGKHVVSDRFILSTIAYQVYGRRKMEYLHLVKNIFTETNHDCVPDLTMYLDIAPEIGLKRVEERLTPANRFDKEDLAFHERLREGYKKHLKEFGAAVAIDASRPLEEVWTDVQNAVQSIL
jgi:dTMP kinase